ncbi:uncharacterized protein BCR38DRAFT_334471 [Pseudomassariella vexata]|uniref:Uncharacterized protein n=1 Tax=Pseudomassariella vexata TaxID=1141098 RepID=A0A1Y2EB01_9PEZI|nr:uncharacterized protein BCR38DRAFT_334471 [Pseudomassariella vexata]ORY68597.1 hypothetical protein BCR38DRAFT_334471 [Pseudomassariella vexata]
MSWMDSWSRPFKSQATPAPYYLLPRGESTPYCHSCGRVIGSRRTAAAANAKSEAKYCSSRCRTQKPGKIDRDIERAFVKFLLGHEGGDGSAAAGDTASKREAHGDGRGNSEWANHAGVGAKKHNAIGKKMKGDPRIMVSCSTVEKYVFGISEQMDDQASSTRSGSPEPSLDNTEGNSSMESDNPAVVAIAAYPASEDVAAGTVTSDNNNESSRYIDGDVLARLSIRSGTRIRPPQSVSEVNGSVGGEKGRAERIEETEEMLEKRRVGQRRAKEREMVRCAARRGVVFGFVLGEGRVDEEEKKRLCEAVMVGKVVEPSFAKGDWAIRWRE